MRLQDIFDEAAAHLMGMKGPSLDADGDACVYRGKDDDCEFNGQKCAVGLFIADQHYSPDLEGSGMSNQLVAESVAKSWDQDVLRPDQLLLLHDLQTAHDETSRGLEWPNSIVAALDGVATKHHLRFDPKGASA